MKRLAVIIFSVCSIALSVHAQNIVNGSFQTGDLTGWEALGITSVVNGIPQAGNQALVRSSIGADVPTQVNPFLGVTLPGNGNGGATNGSAIRQNFSSGTAGRVFFNYSHQTDEGIGSGYDESGVVINGVFFGLGNSFSNGLAAPGNGFGNGVPYQRGVVQTNAGANTLGFVAYDTGDNSVSSGLYITDIFYLPYFGSMPGLTPNQSAIANSLDSIPLETVLSGPARDLVVNLTTQTSDAASLGAALNQLSPQKLEVLPQIGINNATFTTQQVNNHLANLRDGSTGIDTTGLKNTDTSLDPLLGQVKSRLLAWNPITRPNVMSDTRDPLLAGVSSDDSKTLTAHSTSSKNTNRWSAFVSGNAVFADVNHSDNLPDSDYTTGGMQLGIDYRVYDYLTVGLLFGYGHTDVNLDNNGSDSSVDSFTPGFYASYVNGSWYANGLFTYSHSNYDTKRNISIGSLNGTASGSTDGDQWSLGVTGGHEFKSGNWTYGPEIGLTYVGGTISGYSESGPASLTISDQNVDSLRSRLGAQARYNGKLGGVGLTPRVAAFWQHEFLNGSRGISAQFNQLGANGFTVQTTRLDSDFALVNAGIDIQVCDNVMVFADYLAQVGQEDFFAQSAFGGVKVSF